MDITKGEAQLSRQDIRLLMFALGVWLGTCTRDVEGGKLTQDVFDRQKQRVLEIDAKLERMMKED